MPIEDADLENLSAEERAALASEEDLESLEDVKKEIAGLAKEEKVEEDEVKYVDQAVLDAEKAKQDAAPKKEEEVTEEEVEDAPPIPRYVADESNYDKDVEELNKARTALLESFKSGEITIEDLLAGNAELDQVKTDLVIAKVKSDVSKESAEQYSRQYWEWEVNKFMSHIKKTENIDYKNDRILNAALDAEVKALANDEKNNDKTSDWFLNEAHAAIKTRFATPGKAQAKPGTPDAQRKPNLSVVPKTLSDVAGGDGGKEDVGGSDFAYLDNLSGIELEMAVAKMSKEDQERWVMAK